MNCIVLCEFNIFGLNICCRSLVCVWGRGASKINKILNERALKFYEPIFDYNILTECGGNGADASSNEEE